MITAKVNIKRFPPAPTQAEFNLGLKIRVYRPPVARGNIVVKVLQAGTGFQLAESQFANLELAEMFARQFSRGDRCAYIVPRDSTDLIVFRDGELVK